jgi:hypothetical protein
MFLCAHWQKRKGYHYSCTIVPLFELGSLHHDYYLLNVRLPVDDNLKMNSGLGRVKDLWLVVSLFDLRGPFKKFA